MMPSYSIREQRKDTRGRLGAASHREGFPPGWYQFVLHHFPLRHLSLLGAAVVLSFRGFQCLGFLQQLAFIAPMCRLRIKSISHYQKYQGALLFVIINTKRTSGKIIIRFFLSMPDITVVRYVFHLDSAFAADNSGSCKGFPGHLLIHLP